MIVCKKCGEKYEDDMPRCLWCDAPNPEHPLNKAKFSAPSTSTTDAVPIQAPTTPEVIEQPIIEPATPSVTEDTPEPSETASVIESEFTHDSAIEQQFRQKGFLWSVVLAGPFVSWLCHYKYLKQTDKYSTKFFLPLFGLECGSNYLVGLLANVRSSTSGMLSPLLFLFVTIAVGLFYWIIIGKLGFVLLKRAVPSYNPAAFKKRERIGITIGIPIFILGFIAGYLHYGTTARMLGTWIANALR